MATVALETIVRVAGRAICLEGDNVDTDRILPSRYLKHLTFDALGEHVFEGDRANARAAGETHPFDDTRRVGGTILFAGENFGCGSSREHAPQALFRWGVRAIVGVSYGEIFQGNAAAIGLPCVVLAPADAEAARNLAASDPTLQFVVNLVDRQLTCGETVWPVRINESERERLVTGRWDTFTSLSEAADDIKKVAARLPYLSGFSTRSDE